MPPRQLVVFDFDETLIGLCCMRQLLKFIPNYKRPPMHNVKKTGWVNYAKIIFKELHSMGYSSQLLCKFICSVPAVPGMVKLIHHLWISSKPKYDLILITDCYSILVIEWLKAHKIFEYFTGIYCNPTEISDNGDILPDSYHCANCPFSPPNLCKNRVLNEFLFTQREMKVNYDRVIYIGNGSNDFCPSLCMRPCDLVCARKDDVLADKIKTNRKKLKIQPKLYLWTDGYDLLTKLEQ